MYATDVGGGRHNGTKQGREASKEPSQVRVYGQVNFGAGAFIVPA